MDAQIEQTLDIICKMRMILLNGGFEFDRCGVQWAAAKLACDMAVKEVIMHGDESPLDVLDYLSDKYYSYYRTNPDFEYAYLMIERITDCLVK